MEEEVKKLRAAGFSDEDIRAYIQEQKSSTSAPAPAPAPVSPEQLAAQPVRANETVPDYGGTTAPSWGETLGTVATAVAPYAVPAAIALGTTAVGLGAYKFGSKVLDVGRDIASGMRESNAISADREARLANRPGFGGTPQPAPQPAPTSSPILDAQGRPMQMQPRPMPTAAPAYMPPPAPAAPAPAPSVIQRGTDIANQMRQYAAQRVIPAVSQAGQMVGRGLTAAAPALRVGGMASNALYSGGLNTDEQAELERRRKMAPTISR